MESLAMAEAGLLSVWIGVGGWGMPKFFEAHAEGEGFLAVVKEGSEFGFGPTGDNLLKNLTKDIFGTSKACDLEGGLLGLVGHC